jgi:hypothetical protein
VYEDGALLSGSKARAVGAMRTGAAALLQAARQGITFADCDVQAFVRRTFDYG